jgi:hypothetical protein
MKLLSMNMAGQPSSRESFGTIKCHLYRQFGSYSLHLIQNLRPHAGRFVSGQINGIITEGAGRSEDRKTIGASAGIK